MDELANREGLQYWQNHTGVLYLLHEEADLRTAEHNSRLRAEHGRRQDVLDYEQTLALEPALGHGQRRFAGAVHDTSDGTGDPHQFAIGLCGGVPTARRDIPPRHVGNPTRHRRIVDHPES